MERVAGYFLTYKPLWRGEQSGSEKAHSLPWPRDWEADACAPKGQPFLWPRDLGLCSDCTLLKRSCQYFEEMRVTSLTVPITTASLHLKVKPFSFAQFSQYCSGVLGRRGSEADYTAMYLVVEAVRGLKWMGLLKLFGAIEKESYEYRFTQTCINLWRTVYHCKAMFPTQRYRDSRWYTSS